MVASPYLARRSRHSGSVPEFAGDAKLKLVLSGIHRHRLVVHACAEHATVYEHGHRGERSVLGVAHVEDHRRHPLIDLLEAAFALFPNDFGAACLSADLELIPLGEALAFVARLQRSVACCQALRHRGRCGSGVVDQQQVHHHRARGATDRSNQGCEFVKHWGLKRFLPRASSV
jgi:hypothetical protein